MTLRNVKEEVTMRYTNSPLATYTKISPNKNSPRNKPIDTITIHCAAGNKDSPTTIQNEVNKLLKK